MGYDKLNFSIGRFVEMVSQILIMVQSLIGTHNFYKNTKALMQ